MFDSVLGFLASWFNGFWARVKEMWDKGMAWRVTFWGVAVTVAGWFWSIIHYAGSGFGPAASYLDSIIVPAIGQPPGWFSAKIAIVNTFAPLQEAFGMIVAYVALLVALKSLRIVRACIGWFLRV